MYYLDDEDGSDAVMARHGNASDTRDGMVVGDGTGNCDEDEPSSMEDEVDSTSSRDMNDFSTERDSVDNRLGMGDYYERPSDKSSDNGEGECGADETPQYRHSVTTNWSSSDEETEKYRDRSSLFRRSETSSPDYFHPTPSRGELIS